MASELRREIEEFLYFEAELLDDRKLREWFDLLADDIRYWMPIRHNLFERPEDIRDELSKPGEGFYFDDDRKSLKIRVERAYAKNAWAEMPPSRTRHLITNIRIKKDDGREIEVHSNFLVYRTRMENDQDMFVGERQDILRRVDGGFKIAKRTIILDQAVLTAKNISVFL
jgi:3-phenylpropionate/cinnamic acid dioxygenase small subunit